MAEGNRVLALGSAMLSQRNQTLRDHGKVPGQMLATAEPQQSPRWLALLLLQLPVTVRLHEFVASFWSLNHTKRRLLTGQNTAQHSVLATNSPTHNCKNMPAL